MYSGGKWNKFALEQQIDKECKLSFLNSITPISNTSWPKGVTLSIQRIEVSIYYIFHKTTLLIKNPGCNSLSIE